MKNGFWCTHGCFSTKTRILSHEKNIPPGFTEVSISLYGQKGADLSIRSSQLPVESDWCAVSETDLERTVGRDSVEP